MSFTFDQIPAPKKGQVLLNAHGRGPWYGMDGKPREAYVIGIAGGSGSGKTTVAQAILKHLGHVPTVLILSQDSFYNRLTPEKQALAFKNELDLDHPDAIDTALFVDCLRRLKKLEAVQIPVYSFVHHQRMPDTTYLYGANVIIVEGIMALNSPELRELYDLKVFVNTDSDLQLARRIRRDISERGRDVEGVLNQYLRFVKASYDNYVQPSSKYADIIVPGASNAVAIDLIVNHIHKQLDARSLRFRDKLGAQIEVDRVLAGQSKDGEVDGDGWLYVLERTSQIEGIMTILRNKETPRTDFIFYIDRLSSLIVEKAISLLPYEPASVETPLKKTVEGSRIAAKDLVGVSIARSGGPFADGLRRVIKDVRLGSLLIQSEVDTGEPLLFHTSLPECLRERKQAQDAVVFLMDSQMGTGASALMGVRVLLDHGVEERNIIFLAFLSAKPGVQALHRAFPGVRVVTAACEQVIEEIELPVEDDEQKGSAKVLESTSRPVADLDRTYDTTSKESASAKKVWAIVPDAGAIGDRYYGA